MIKYNTLLELLQDQSQKLCQTIRGIEIWAELIGQWDETSKAYPLNVLGEGAQGWLMPQWTTNSPAVITTKKTENPAAYGYVLVCRLAEFRRYWSNALRSKSQVCTKTMIEFIETKEAERLVEEYDRIGKKVQTKGLNTLEEILTSPYLIEENPKLEVRAIKQGQWKLQAPAYICDASKAYDDGFDWMIDVDILLHFRRHETGGDETKYKDWAKKIVQELNARVTFN